MDDCLSCDVCFNEFDEGCRLPKIIVLCGHTVCQSCLTELHEQKCPTGCGGTIGDSPEGLPTNFKLLDAVRAHRDSRVWCFECNSTGTRRCRDEHMTLCAKAALKRHLVRVPAEAAGELETLPDQCREEQAVQALTLLNSESWVLAIRACSADGQRTTLGGTLRNTGDPLFKAMCLALPVKAELTVRSGNNIDSGVDAVPPLRTAAAEGTAVPTQTRHVGPPTAVPPQAPLPEPPQVRQAAPSAPALLVQAPAVDRNNVDTAGISAAVSQILPGPSGPLFLQGKRLRSLLPLPPAEPPQAFLGVQTVQTVQSVQTVFARAVPPSAEGPSRPPAEPPPAEPPQPHQPAPLVPSRALREMNVSECYNNEIRAAAALEQVQGVGRLIGVFCNMNPGWSLQLLRLAAPTVQELRVRNPQEDHLRAIHAMPRLRDLHVAWSLPSKPDDIELPAIPPENYGLRSLRAYCFPHATLQSLLRANRRTLEELELSVGVSALMHWPWHCSYDELVPLLNECGLRALTRLVLFRVGQSSSSHDRRTCEEMRRPVRELLPRAAVLCDECDRVGELAPM